MPVTLASDPLELVARIGGTVHFLIMNMYIYVCMYIGYQKWVW